ncbi:hypothetical protein, partial [Rhizobium leucaenae]|uniref:hypothetical protein n=1 Tax=Rhizobium leucaenae TaxID=29450 RepID=UPI001AEC6C9A
PRHNHQVGKAQLVLRSWIFKHVVGCVSGRSPQAQGASPSAQIALRFVAILVRRPQRSDRRSRQREDKKLVEFIR